MQETFVDVCEELKNQQEILRYSGTGNCGKPKSFLSLKREEEEMVLPAPSEVWS